MQFNYEDIAMHIRDIRIRKKLSQQNLAELADLSTTHISHIETCNTKVSLPTLVQIANALEVSLDELVCDSLVKAKHVFENEITKTAEDCDEQEIRIIADTVKALKASLRRRVEKRE